MVVEWAGDCAPSFYHTVGVNLEVGTGGIVAEWQNGAKIFYATLGPKPQLSRLYSEPDQ